MARYICPVCRETFNEPRRERWAGDSWDACPECGNPDFEAAAECVCCGQDYTQGELIAGKLCRDCLEHEAYPYDAMAFAFEDDVIESFAEWMVERYGQRWKERRLKPFREELEHGTPSESQS